MLIINSLDTLLNLRKISLALQKWTLFVAHFIALMQIQLDNNNFDSSIFSFYCCINLIDTCTHAKKREPFLFY